MDSILEHWKVHQSCRTASQIQISQANWRCPEGCQLGEATGHKNASYGLHGHVLVDCRVCVI